MKKGLPVFIPLEDEEVLIIGAGKAGLSKLKSISQMGLVPQVVSPKWGEGWDQAPDHQRIFRPFEEDDLEGKKVVFACTDILTLNLQIARLGREKGVLVNPAGTQGGGDFLSMPFFLHEEKVLAFSSLGADRSGSLALKKQVQQYFREVIHAF